MLGLLGSLVWHGSALLFSAVLRQALPCSVLFLSLSIHIHTYTYTAFALGTALLMLDIWSPWVAPWSLFMIYKPDSEITSVLTKMFHVAGSNMMQANES